MKSLWRVLMMYLNVVSICSADEFAGKARVVDGDTLVVQGIRIRLAAIDAPETDQVCLDASSERWACGIEARDNLARKINNREVSCLSTSQDVYRRQLAKCRVGSESLNEWLVRNGWALAYVQYSAEYAAAEKAARSAKLGLWSGAFIAPWDWRHRSETTLILGAYAVPVNAQKQLLKPRDESPDPNCAIKGNINSKGEKIYHMPDQRYYQSVQMSASAGKRWFCSREDAEAAGWRASPR